MFGENPKRPPIKGDGNTLEIQEIFQTIQGEGLYAGWPSVFIRLGGCNLACDFCDTEFENYKPIALTDIISTVQSLSNKGAINLAVITGGEPLRQPIGKLCSLLIENGFIVQIETNGTLFQELDERVDVVCSPKNTNGTYSQIRPDLLERISAFKFIISAHDKNYSNTAEIGQSLYNVPVYIQPMDEQDPIKNTANLNLAIKLAMANGYRLSMQLHKLIGLK
jgi:7-carboxy-7-deazaguanine synthase